MEALAAGDTRSPIVYNDHADCVGRMARALAIFRDNLSREADHSGQEHVVRELGRASGSSPPAT